jgi:fermentation-respiration switch protein FrsA (DUF1100 family)
VRRDIEFAVEDGTLLRGFMYGAEHGPAPAVVMAHGFSGVKGQIDHYAAAFAAGGFAVLVYDHRGFGDSDGQPRLEVDPARQIADWRDAISVAARQPEVDPAAGFGIWGSSFAGGLAMVLAANDARVKCVVSQIPNVSGHRNGREMFSVTQHERLRALFDADRTARLSGAEPMTLPVFSVDQDELCALPPAVRDGYVDAVIAATPSWVNRVTVRSVEHMLSFEPAAWAPYLAPTPVLMIVGAQDVCTFAHLQLEVYDQIHHPKALVVHPGGHFDTYRTHFGQTSQAALDWFLRHLTPGAKTSDGHGNPAPLKVIHY